MRPDDGSSGGGFRASYKWYGDCQIGSALGYRRKKTIFFVSGKIRSFSLVPPYYSCMRKLTFLEIGSSEPCEADSSGMVAGNFAHAGRGAHDWTDSNTKLASAPAALAGEFTPQLAWLAAAATDITDCRHRLKSTLGRAGAAEHRTSTMRRSSSFRACRRVDARDNGMGGRRRRRWLRRQRGQTAMMMV